MKRFRAAGGVTIVVVLVSVLAAARPGVAWAGAPDPVVPVEPAIGYGGITLSLTPLVTVPAENDIPQYNPITDPGLQQPLSRILYADPVAGDGGRLFVNVIGGEIYQTTAPGAAPSLYLDLRTQNIGFFAGPDPGSNGLNGMAFSPNFAGDPGKPGYGKLYTSAWTTNAQGTPVVEIREWTTTDPAAATFSGTSRAVMQIDNYTTGHANGMIAFNPTAKPGDADYGNLYIGSGDGQYFDPAQNAQNLGSLQGKMLRINPLEGADGQAYTIPSDNPYVAGGGLPEIWASGLRNPQSFTWDAVTGQMYINDIGQNLFEEVNVGIAGANYGWDLREGLWATAPAYGLPADDEQGYPLPVGDAGFTYPVCGYTHGEGYSMGSGILYRGSAIPELDGKYIMQDIVTGRLFACDPSQGGDGTLAAMSEILLDENGQDINLQLSFGYNSWLTSPRVDTRLSVDGDGELLMLMKADGGIYRLGQAVDTPEPGSVALLAAGLIGLAGLRRRVVAGGRRRD